MLNDHDVSIVIDLARGLTGNVVDRMRHGVIAQNVWARMQQLKYRDFESYLRYVASNDSEISHLVSALTIHTTSWFREPSTCEKFSEIATAFAAKGEKAAFRVLSIGCSTGEEVYSYGLILDSIKSRYPTFEYVLEGWDIDPQCLKVARSAMYSISGLSAISQSFRHLIRPMQGISFHVPSQVVERCRWRIVNLDKPPKEQITFDFISCRNLLIYFSPKQITAALEFMSGILVPKGHLCVGVSESTSVNVPNLLARGRSTFQLNENRLSLTSQQPDLPDYTKNARKFTPEVIAFGASTGGTEELARLLSHLPARCPPVLVVQHISPNFSRDFALRLAQVSGLKLGQMQAGEDLREGMIYVPLRDYHIGVRRFGGLLKLVIGEGPAVNRHKPSVDVLFNSLADARVRTFAAILTGMGRDGADGLLRLRTSGAITWAQDERSSAVFGMPKEAIKINAATHVGNPTQIRHHLDNILLAMDRIQVIKKTGS